MKNSKNRTNVLKIHHCQISKVLSNLPGAIEKIGKAAKDNQPMILPFAPKPIRDACEVLE
jgi:hypothetical protein